MKRARAESGPFSKRIEDFNDEFEAFAWLGAMGSSYATPSREPEPEPGPEPAPEPESSSPEPLSDPEPESEASSEASAEPEARLPLAEVADFLCFDTETSGLGREAAVVQFALGFFDKDGRALGFYDKLWRCPPGVRISAGSERIHGISNRRLANEGLEAAPEMRKVLCMMRTMLKRGKKLVAHNAAFDLRMLAQTARAHGADSWDLEKAQVFCTMQNAKARCGLTASNGRAKAPSNAELFKFLTGEAPRGALHDAQVDVSVTGRSYAEGRRRGWWG